MWVAGNGLFFDRRVLGQVGQKIWAWAAQWEAGLEPLQDERDREDCDGL